MSGRVCILGVALALASASVAAQQGKPAAVTVRSQWSGIYSDAQAKRGEPLYTAECAFCHGAQLEGTFAAPPLTATALSGRWGSKTLADLFEYQRAFMPWTSPGGFSREKNVDILAYILKTGGFPAGANLPLAADAQREIRIVAAKL
jgi:S-disulfanyl-L-cysteine oxidoreductase SoxD